MWIDDYHIFNVESLVPKT